MNRDVILEKVRSLMAELFQLSPEQITLETRLVEDLDLDSIDAVDLIVKLQDYTGKKVQPEEFKEIRTVADVVDKIVDIVAR